MRDLLSEAQWERLVTSFKLTPRELDVAKAIFDDKTEEAIGRELGISAKTVHTYVERLYHKTQTSSRLSLALYFVAQHYPPGRGTAADFEE